MGDIVMREPVSIHLHPDSVLVGFIGIDRGLSGNALDLFRTMLKNIEATIDVDDETGEVKIISLSGLPFASQLMCVEKLEGLIEQFGDEEDMSALHTLREFFGKK
jgi:hypothetical protein